MGLVVRGPVRQISDDSVVDTSTARGTCSTVSAQDALGLTSWHYRTLVDGYVTFAHPDVLPPVWIAALRNGAPGPPDVDDRLGGRDRPRVVAGAGDGRAQ